jgi:hypothetical protein
MAQRLLTLFVCTFFLPSLGLRAQVQSGGQPYFLKEAFRQIHSGLSIPEVALPVPDVARALAEDAEKPDGSRFAVPIPASLSLSEQGAWTKLDNGDRVWHLRVASPNAQGLALMYEDFYLPPGARLFAFDETGQQLLGAYTTANNTSSGKFLTGFLNGDHILLEYYEPVAVQGQGRFRIFRAEYAYRSGGPRNFGFGQSSSCHFNINCPEGGDWQEEKRGICRIMMVLEEGTGWCSGSLINNTDNNGTPYVLSAYHCQSTYTPIHDLWRFDFNYEAPGCVTPANAPAFQSVLGAVQRAGRQQTDFLLLEILEPIPSSYFVYFNGWNRSTGVPQESACIHHPLADVKKISIDTNPAFIQPTPLTWSNNVTTPANHHFRVIYDIGTFESASSGAPLFNSQGQIVGQLHGGFPNCTQVTTFHGRFNLSWDAGQTPDEQLQPWLDPGNTGIMSLNGYQPPTPMSGSVAGRIYTTAGQGVAGVTVTLSGAQNLSMLTDTTGQYMFADLPLNATYTISFAKTYNAVNGVTTSDMIPIRLQILNLQPLGDPYLIMAADANGSNTVTTADLVDMRKVILLLEPQFVGRPSWQFVPAEYGFPDPDNPFANPIPNQILIPNLEEDFEGLDVIGVKTGDMNNSVNPYDTQ